MGRRHGRACFPPSHEASRPRRSERGREATPSLEPKTAGLHRAPCLLPIFPAQEARMVTTFSVFRARSCWGLPPPPISREDGRRAGGTCGGGPAEVLFSDHANNRGNARDRVLGGPRRRGRGRLASRASRGRRRHGRVSLRALSAVASRASRGRRRAGGGSRIAGRGRGPLLARAGTGYESGRRRLGGRLLPSSCARGRHGRRNT